MNFNQFAEEDWEIEICKSRSTTLKIQAELKQILQIERCNATFTKEKATELILQVPANFTFSSFTFWYLSVIPPPSNPSVRASRKFTFPRSYTSWVLNGVMTGGLDFIWLLVEQMHNELSTPWRASSVIPLWRLRKKILTLPG